MFNIITRSRQTGKTTALISIFKRNPQAILIVHRERRKVEMALAYGLSGTDLDRIYTVDNVRDRLRGKQAGTILIDDLDVILPQLLGVPYAGEHGIIATATGVSL